MKKETKWVELGEICEFQVGLPAREKEIFEENISGQLQPFIKVKNLQDFRISTENLSWIDSNAFNQIQNFVVYPEEILISKDGTVGKLAINDSKKNLYFSSTIYKLIPSKIINQKFLFYALRAKQKEISKFHSLGPIPHLELKVFKKLKIPLPSIEQQEKIAKWLETFSSLERQLERHKTQYRYYLNRLMRGGANDRTR